jgi:hypothetical protein
MAAPTDAYPLLFSEIRAYLYDQLYMYIWGICAYSLILFGLIFCIFIHVLRQTWNQTIRYEPPNLAER